MGGIPRRLFTGTALAAALGVVGCAPARPAVDARPARTAAPVATHPSTAPPSAAPTPPPTPAGPDPAVVAQRYAEVEPQDWGMHLAGITSELEVPKTPDGRPRVALTLDACGGKSGSGYDDTLIEGLADIGVPATLFVNSRWMEANPRVIQELASEPLFELGNHGTRHVPLSVTGREAYGIAGSANAQEAVDEVWQCHEQLAAATGAAPRLFRSGTAHYDDVGVAIANALDQIVVGFSTNGDAGATYSPTEVRREVTKTKPGGIVIAHFNQPSSGTAEGLLDAVHRMLDEGVEFVLL